MKLPSIVTALLLIGAAGCQPAQDQATEPAPHAPAEPPVAAGPASTQAETKTTGDLTATPALDARIALLEESKTDKKKLAEVYAERGAARMNDPAAAPRVKYPAALRDFRVALRHDPTNATAKEGRDLIEGIYKSMGRSVPE